MALDLYSLRQRAIPGSRVARCEEVDCAAHINGWITKLAATDRHRLAAVRASGRHFTYVVDGDWVTFRFPAGQQCFAEHAVDKAQLYIPPSRQPTTADLWVEQFGENQQRLSERQARG